MKLVFLLFVIAMATQGAVAAPLARIKRDGQSVKVLEEAIETAKRLLPAVQTIISNALKEIPRTQAYDTYRQELQGFLDKVHKGTNKKSNCLQKILGYITTIAEIRGEYKKDDAPAEAKEIDRLISQQNVDDLKKDVDHLTKLLATPLIDSESDESEESERITELILAEC